MQHTSAQDYGADRRRRPPFAPQGERLSNGPLPAGSVAIAHHFAGVLTPRSQSVFRLVTLVFPCNAAMCLSCACAPRTARVTPQHHAKHTRGTLSNRCCRGRQRGRSFQPGESGQPGQFGIHADGGRTAGGYRTVRLRRWQRRQPQRQPGHRPGNAFAHAGELRPPHSQDRPGSRPLSAAGPVFRFHLRNRCGARHHLCRLAGPAVRHRHGPKWLGLAEPARLCRHQQRHGVLRQQLPGRRHDLAPGS